MFSKIKLAAWSFALGANKALLMIDLVVVKNPFVT